MPFLIWKKSWNSCLFRIFQVNLLYTSSRYFIGWMWSKAWNNWTIFAENNSFRQVTQTLRAMKNEGVAITDMGYEIIENILFFTQLNNNFKNSIRFRRKQNSVAVKWKTEQKWMKIIFTHVHKFFQLLIGDNTSAMFFCWLRFLKTAVTNVMLIFEQDGAVYIVLNLYGINNLIYY